MDKFVIPGKGVYGGLTLSSPADDKAMLSEWWETRGAGVGFEQWWETINIGPGVENFQFEQRLSDEDGTPQDIIVLGTGKLSETGRGAYVYPFLATFFGNLSSVRRLSFLPLGEYDRNSSEYRNAPEIFLPKGPLTLDVGIVERTTGYDRDNSREYSVVLQVL